jgi:hypothetical protein
MCWGGALRDPTQMSSSRANQSQKGKVFIYGIFVVGIRPNKSEVHRVRLTVGVNLIQYPGDISTRSAINQISFILIALEQC